MSEANRFVWPGPDLHPIAPERFDYGFLPPALFCQVQAQMGTYFAARRLLIVPRTEYASQTATKQSANSGRKIASSLRFSQRQVCASRNDRWGQGPGVVPRSAAAASIFSAAAAAPNPLSMLTTTTPDAQLASAACRATTPPVATP